MRKLKYKVLRIIILMLIVLFAYCIKVDAFTVVLDPGHGGSDSGSVNVRKNIKEADINYKIASHLSNYLNGYENVKVLITRTANQYKSLEERADIAINSNANLLMSLHINSAESGSPTGACTYVTYRTDFDKYKKNCTELSNLILTNLSKLGIKNNGVRTRVCKDNEPKWMYADETHADYYGIIRYCMKGTKGDGIENEINISSGESIPVVLIEHCYIKNGDEQYIDSDSDIQRIAKCDLDALVSYYHLKPKTKMIVPTKAKIVSVKNVSKKSAKVTWKKDTQITGYEVYMSTAKKDTKYMKSKSKLTLRKSTSTKSKKVVNIPKGAKVQILKKNVKRSGGYTWYKVKYNGKTGYVASKYLETIYKEGKYSKVKTITKNKTTSYTKTKLSKGKKYTFKIRSYKVVDGIKYYASYSNVKWVTIKK